MNRSQEQLADQPDLAGEVIPEEVEQVDLVSLYSQTTAKRKNTSTPTARRSRANQALTITSALLSTNPEQAAIGQEISTSVRIWGDVSETEIIDLARNNEKKLADFLLVLAATALMFFATAPPLWQTETGNYLQIALCIVFLISAISLAINTAKKTDNQYFQTLKQVREEAQAIGISIPPFGQRRMSRQLQELRHHHVRQAALEKQLRKQNPHS